MFLDVIVTPWERFMWGPGKWLVVAVPVLVVAAAVTAVIIAVKKRKK